jgi:hypothetical protein
MTQLAFAVEQTGRFHETKYEGERARFLAAEWQELICMLPTHVEQGFGVPVPARQLERFAVPVGTEVEYDDPRWLIEEIAILFDQFDEGPGPDVLARSGQLLDSAFGRQVERMRNWWHAGYTPRYGSVRIGGDAYGVYNYQPAFSFTGRVRSRPQFNANAGVYEPWLFAEFDTSPLRDEGGDLVSFDPAVPVIMLPTMTQEAHVDHRLAAAHLVALHDSLSPFTIQAYAPGLPELVEQERGVAESLPTRPWPPAMARVAVTNSYF